MPATIYTARERETTSIPIKDVFREGEIDILPAVQGRDFFDIRFQGSRLRITAGKYVGLIPLNDSVFIQVEPKMPVGNLLQLLSAVGGDLVELAVLERDYKAANTAAPSITAAISRAFVTALQRIETDGLKKAYARIVESGSTLKGQIQFHASIEQFWSRGTRHSASYDYFDLSADLVENRLLRYASNVLLAQHRAAALLPKTAAALFHFDEWFSRAGVQLERPHLPSQRSSDHGNSPSYRRATRLARLIVSGHGIELPGGGSDVALPSFLVNMESLFESYVRHVLCKRLKTVDVLDGNGSGSKPLFDDRLSPLANPDVAIRRLSGDWALIVEVKYKAAANRDDINQVLAYAMAYRVRQVVLVTPADNESATGLITVGQVQGVELFCYRFNLSAANLVLEEQRFGEEISRLINQLEVV